jgi:hypothetical protein
VSAVLPSSSLRRLPPHHTLSTFLHLTLLTLLPILLPFRQLSRLQHELTPAEAAAEADEKPAEAAEEKAEEKAAEAEPTPAEA